ncbi:NAD(P)-binding domain-containing protein [Streptomyces capparidis]
MTVLGLGPMGQALARAFLSSGHPTTVWNRTASKAAALVERGAVLADSAAAAVAASPLTVVCVMDYTAVEAIVSPAAAALKGRTLVNLTADSPDRARAMAEWAAGHGVDYLDGSIMTPTTTIGGPSAVFLYSGPEDVYEAHRPTLASLGGTATHLGADPGRAAAHDVALLDIWWTAVAGIAHGYALAAAEGIGAKEFAAFARGIGDLLPDTITEIAGDLDAGRYPGDEANLRSAAAGMEHIVHTARARGLDTGTLDAALAMARRAIDAGHGDDGLARLTEVLGREAGAR